MNSAGHHENRWAVNLARKLIKLIQLIHLYLIYISHITANVPIRRENAPNFAYRNVLP